MRDPFDELERRLLAAASERHAGRRPVRPWFRGLVAATAAALLVSGGALAATRLVSQSPTQDDPAEIVARAVTETDSLPACRRYDASEAPTLTDAAPLAGITSTLPALAAPASPDQQAQAIALVPHGGLTGPVLRSTVRLVPAADGASLLTYVELGIGGGAPIDPAACGAARHAKATALAGDQPAVLADALHRLEGMKDTVVGLQTLHVFVRLPGESAMLGGGVPVRPDERLDDGVVAAGTVEKGRRVFGVIAGPRTASVQVSDGSGRTEIADGMYVVRAAEGADVVVREFDSDGKVLRARRLP